MVDSEALMPGLSAATVVTSAVGILLFAGITYVALRLRRRISSVERRVGTLENGDAALSSSEGEQDTTN
jgi:biopolymer transport protein ExbB/TolQ